MSGQYNKLQSIRLGHFDWAHPDVTQVCFDFGLRADAPEELKKHWSFTLPEEYNVFYDSALEAARALDNYKQSVWYSSDARYTAALVLYLEKYEEEDAIAAKVERLETLRTRREGIDEEIKTLEESLVLSPTLQ